MHYFIVVVWFQRTSGDEKRSSYEEERIMHAKRILKPFVLRRLKSEVSIYNHNTLKHSFTVSLVIPPTNEILESADRLAGLLLECCDLNFSHSF